MHRLAIRTLALVAFNITALCFIVRSASFTLTVALVSTLLVANILLGIVFRSIPPEKGDLPAEQTVGQLHLASGLDYIPVLGGLICFLVGLSEFSWKPCVTGIAAIAIGGCRIRFRARVRPALRDRH